MSKEVATRTKVEPVGEAEKSYGRATTRIQVATAVWTLWDRLRKEQGIDQQWLADRMGKDKSWASRLLKGPGNWTLDTVGDLLEAMGARLTCVEAHTYEEISQGNAAHASRRHGSRRILKIEAEILLIDDPEKAENGEINWASPMTVSSIHSLAVPVIEQEELS